jgi:hypothetical protein
MAPRPPPQAPHGRAAPLARAACDCFRWRRYSAVNESASDLAGAASSGINSLSSSQRSTPGGGGGGVMERGGLALSGGGGGGAQHGRLAYGFPQPAAPMLSAPPTRSLS